VIRVRSAHLELQIGIRWQAARSRIILAVTDVACGRALGPEHKRRGRARNRRWQCHVDGGRALADLAALNRDAGRILDHIPFDVDGVGGVVYLLEFERRR
jgi:hypothetical protein